MLILCRYCRNARCLTYDDWIEHLLENDHQKAASETVHSWDLPLNERSLVISINGEKQKKDDVCWYFANYGLVTDAVFEKNLEFCVIQLEKRDCAERALMTGHSMEGATLTIRLKSTVSDAEIISMFRGRGIQELSVRNKIETNAALHSKLIEVFKSYPLDCQMERFINEIKINDVELSLRSKLLDEMRKLCAVDFRHCILHPYGSFVTGLGDSSELRVYFDKHGKDETSYIDDKCYRRRILDELHTAIDEANCQRIFCYDFVALPRNELPCIKFTHFETGVKFMFTFDNLLSVRTSNLIALYMELDERLIYLFSLVRHLGKYYHITGPHLLSNYSLYLLVLCFLMVHKIIPSVAVLQALDGKEKSVKIGHWDTNFHTNVTNIQNVMAIYKSATSYDKSTCTGKPTAKSILIMVSEFCKMYTCLDLKSLVVCPAIGEFRMKTEFAPGNEDKLPKGLQDYKMLVKIAKKEHLKTKSLLCIQDPFILTRNVTYHTPTRIVQKFQQICADTVVNIDAILKSPNPNLMDIFKPKPNMESKEATPPKSLTMSNNIEIITNSTPLTETFDFTSKSRTPMPMIIRSIAKSTAISDDVEVEILPTPKPIHKNIETITIEDDDSDISVHPVKTLPRNAISHNSNPNNVQKISVLHKRASDTFSLSYGGVDLAPVPPSNDWRALYQHQFSLQYTNPSPISPFPRKKPLLELPAPHFANKPANPPPQQNIQFLPPPCPPNNHWTPSHNYYDNRTLVGIDSTTEYFSPPSNGQYNQQQ